MAYVLGKEISQSYAEWLLQPLNMNKSPETKVTDTSIVQPRFSFTNHSQARQPLLMWKDAKGDRATPKAMVAALKTMPLTTDIVQKIEREFRG